MRNSLKYVFDWLSAIFEILSSVHLSEFQETANIGWFIVGQNSHFRHEDRRINNVDAKHNAAILTVRVAYLMKNLTEIAGFW